MSEAIVVTDEARRDLGHALLALMSDISEDCYCASWLVGLEYSLWHVVEGADQFGMCFFGPDDLRVSQLRSLRDLSGYWAVWSHEVGDAVLISVDEWRSRLEHAA
ncbi:MAG: hypothetical protein IT337_09270 [Thermomicrobiales bacterium]|nr:hypothetical protein [Thermomicrobiales bacterium]